MQDVDKASIPFDDSHGPLMYPDIKSWRDHRPSRPYESGTAATGGPNTEHLRSCQKLNARRRAFSRTKPLANGPNRSANWPTDIVLDPQGLIDERGSTARCRLDRPAGHASRSERVAADPQAAPPQLHGQDEVLKITNELGPQRPDVSGRATTWATSSSHSQFVQSRQHGPCRGITTRCTRVGSGPTAVCSAGRCPGDAVRRQGQTPQPVGRFLPSWRNERRPDAAAFRDCQPRARTGGSSVTDFTELSGLIRKPSPRVLERQRRRPRSEVITTT